MLRRTVALLVGVVALALAVAPIAQAAGGTIKAAPGMQFSGVVDGSPSCHPGVTTINWGDNSPQSAGTIDPNNFAISGTHIYGAAGTYNGTVTLNRGNCAATAPQVDHFTAQVNLPANPQFRQCPPVDNDSGCQFLIVASSGGSTIEQDANQLAVNDGADVALIGIQNNMSSPISSIPLAGTPNLFGFKGDGLCDPGSSPVPSGCRPTGTPPGTACDPSKLNCAFPAPPGQPAGYVEPGNLAGDAQNGYEGPTNWFSSVSADRSSGQINFSPALQPGQSTFFSVGEPASASSLNASANPQGLATAPPTVSGTGASFAGFVDPNGSATTAVFQYGLDSRYGRASGPYNYSTPAQALGGDFSAHSVATSVNGLVPNALYHVRLAATNRNGTSFGPDTTFTLGKLPAPAPPTIGKTFNASVASGLVLVKQNGQWIPLTELSQFPNGTQIDALHGTLNLITSTGRKHKTYSGAFGGAIFKVTQARTGADKGQATLAIVEGAYKGAPSYASCKKRAADGPLANVAVSSRILQTLRAKARGRFRTRGRFAAGTVRGTQWNTIDRCNATGVQVITHSVLVTDFVKHITVVVKAGHRYIASK